MIRLTAIVVGVGALALALLDAFGASPLVHSGVTLTVHGGRFQIAAVDPGSAAARAHLKAGQFVDLSGTSLDTRICVFGSPPNSCMPGAPVTVLVRGATGQPRPATFTPQYHEFSAVQAPLGRYIDLALAFLYLGFALLILTRAPRGRLTDIVIWLMVLYALTNGTADFNGAATSPIALFAINSVFQQITLWAIGALIILGCALVAAPEGRTRRQLERLAVPLGICATTLPYVCNIIGRGLANPWLLDAHTTNALSVLCVLISVATSIALLSVASAVPVEQRVRARWFVSTIVVCFYLGFSIYGINQQFFGNAVVFVVSYYLVSFALVGPVYATLRHHLIDLDVALSRSAVFAGVSAFLLLAFIAAEWLASKISDSVAGEGRWHGLTAQLLSFAAAVVVGLWMRGLHARTERSVNAVLFRERERRLHLLRAFAREADVVDERNLLLNVTFEALNQSLETPDVAIYLADGEGFACVRTSSSASPERLGKGDRPVLTLLRDAGTFLNESEPLAGWVIVPLPARVHVVGFFACGPKRDRTRYLTEELTALENVAQHVGASYAMLGSAAAKTTA